MSGNIIGNTDYGKIAESRENIKHAAFRSEESAKIGEELTAVGVNWSGKINGNKTTLAVNIKDEAVFTAAVSKVKSQKISLSDRLKASTAKAAELNANRDKQDKTVRNKAAEL